MKQIRPQKQSAPYSRRLVALGPSEEEHLEIEPRRPSRWSSQSDDSELLIAARTEPAAFGTFYDRHSRDLFSFFYRRTLCPDTSADLTAETFAAALESLHRYNPGQAGRGWVFGIAHNQFRMWLRKGRVADRARRRMGVTTPEVDHRSLERLNVVGDLEALAAALEQLRPALRDAVVLRIGYDLPYAEVARQLGCTESNARLRVARAMDKLVNSMGV